MGSTPCCWEGGISRYTAMIWPPTGQGIIPGPGFFYLCILTHLSPGSFSLYPKGNMRTTVRYDLIIKLGAVGFLKMWMLYCGQRHAWYQAPSSRAAQVYGMRLLSPNSCPNNGSREPDCPCVRDDSPRWDTPSHYRSFFPGPV